MAGNSSWLSLLLSLFLVSILSTCSRVSRSTGDELMHVLDSLSANSPEEAVRLAKSTLERSSYALQAREQGEAYYALSKTTLERGKYSERLGAALIYAKISLQAFARAKFVPGRARAHYLLAAIYLLGIREADEPVYSFPIEEKYLPDTVRVHLETSVMLLKDIASKKDSAVLAGRIRLLEQVLHERGPDKDASRTVEVNLLKQALSLFTKAGHEEGKAIAYRNLSVVYEKDCKVDSALYYAKQALIPPMLEKSSIGLHHAMHNMGLLFLNTYKQSIKPAHLDSACFWYRKALDIPGTEKAETLLQLGLAYHEALMHVKEGSPLYRAYLDSCAIAYRRGIWEAAAEDHLTALYNIGENLPTICAEQGNYGNKTPCEQDLKTFNQVYYGMASTIRKAQAESELAYSEYRLAAARNESKRRIVQIALIAVCSLLALGTAAYGLYQSRLARAYRQELMAKLQALQAWLNPHFTNGALNAIDLLFKRNSESASMYLVKFSRLTHMLMEFGTDKLISMEHEVSFLEYYLELEKLRFGDLLNYRLIVELKDAQSDLLIPPMMVQPFVENGIKHGIQPKDEPGNLVIHFLQKGKMLQCTVDDDGVGRKQFENKETPTRNRPSSTETILQRVDLLKKIQNASLEIVDLVDPLDGKALGTRVVINIPLIHKPIQNGNV